MLYANRSDDEAHMRAAVALASRGLGESWPNPSVGCVIVNQGRVVGRGRTGLNGRPHAETQALAAAAGRARGATAYVTLEPCAHTGQTPPCANALIAAGIARVVIGLPDPNPTAAGGIGRLRAAAIDVEHGILADSCAELTEGFLRRINDHRPMITLKLATTLDGRIATRTGASQWITGDQARQAAHALRATHDAILVGVGTVLSDNPTLTCRLAGARATPLIRIIADSHLRTPLTSTLLATARDTPTWFLTTTGTDPARIAAATGAGADILRVPATDSGIDLPAALRVLADRGLTRVLAEGGARLAAALLRDNLVDHLAWFHAPAIIGQDGIPAAGAFGVTTLADMPSFTPTGHQSLGRDTLTLMTRQKAA